MSSGIIRLALAWIALMALLALNLGLAYLQLHWAAPLVSYTIAALQTALMLWFLMEMRREPGLMRLAIAAGFVFVGFLLVLASTDYITRR
jgi:cytochrome c oxidase subunit 4